MITPQTTWDQEAREAAKAHLPIVVEIAAPPCPGCFHWGPVAKTNEHGAFTGIVLCHGDQVRDFSCFYDKSRPRARGEK